ncbi:MAG: hypothetical protein HKN17_04770, partial [Rhodothermales bacterium]|nr:hypothetical protein [Rhodothermales bacterium]
MRIAPLSTLAALQFTCLVLVGLSQPAAARQDSAGEVAFLPGTRDAPVWFENVTLEDGLNQSNVFDIEQDRKGFMWFATQVGLNRFDGTEIVRYLPDPFDSTSVHDAVVWDIEEDADGFLWLAHVDGTIARFDPGTGRFRNYAASETDSILTAIGGSFDLAIGPDGNVWAGGFGVLRLDAETGEIRRWGTRADNGGDVGWIESILAESSGTFIVTGENAVYRFDPGEGTFTALYETNSMGKRPVHDPHDPDVIWHGSYTEGVFRYNTRTAEVRTYDVTTGPGGASFSVVPDPMDPGIVWAASFEGLVRLDKESGGYHIYQGNPGGPEAGKLLGASIGPIHADTGGLLWASAFGFGVSRFDPAAIGFERHGTDPRDPNGMRGQTVGAVLPMDDGVVWALALGTSPGHAGANWWLNRIDRRTGR